jgi:hypothetical protein
MLSTLFHLEVGLRVLISVSHSSYSSATYGMQDERVLPLQVSKRIDRDNEPVLSMRPLD